MQFSLATVLLGLSAVSSAAVLQRRQAFATGECCIPNTSLKQDVCQTSAGESGRCVPGGNDCGGALSCVADANLGCDDSIEERGSTLCRATFGSGFIDGANVISSLDQAQVN
ncbi:hypothetical protein F4780DRAFT_783866 [Xylariomycetidae sp. FL0641]|nr:hypothetical protein F4780DRAFT_783866 [Xylariomycetidae sp. FL0641]